MELLLRVIMAVSKFRGQCGSRGIEIEIKESVCDPQCLDLSVQFKESFWESRFGSQCSEVSESSLVFGS